MFKSRFWIDENLFNFGLTFEKLRQEKDRLSVKLEEERTKAESNLRDVISSGLREQSKLKAEMAEMVLQFKVCALFSLVEVVMT